MHSPRIADLRTPTLLNHPLYSAFALRQRSQTIPSTTHLARTDGTSGTVSASLSDRRNEPSADAVIKCTVPAKAFSNDFQMLSR